MRNTVRATAVASLLVVPALISGAPDAQARDSDDLKAKAKEVIGAYRDAVIHVKVAVKTTMSFQGNEMPGRDEQLELLGTVIDASGLTVLSEAGLNPGEMLKAMMGGMGMGGDDDSLQIKSEVGDVKMVMKDGKEIPGRVVLRDKDLDLAFVVPTDKGMKFTAAPLDGGAAPEALDDVIVVSRLGRNLDRAPTVMVGRVTAIVRKPRTFYVSDVSGGGIMATGCPAFDGSGKPIGIFLQRRAGAVGGGGGIMGMVSQMLPVILPCEDVREGAQQALLEAAKPPVDAPKPVDTKKPDAPMEEPKEEEPKPEEPKNDPPKTDEPK